MLMLTKRTVTTNNISYQPREVTQGASICLHLFSCAVAPDSAQRFSWDFDLVIVAKADSLLHRKDDSVANVLDKIVDYKRGEIATAKLRRSLAEIQSSITDAPQVRSFTESLKSHHPMGLIAEVKRASPSAGLIREDFDAVEIARIYEQNGAACISVLTDEHFFQGSLEYLKQVRKQAQIPVLRKDFILDAYQVYEARSAGADATLLLAECLNDRELHELYSLTIELGMEALVELYEPANIERVLKLNPPLVGVNNRNLQTFDTDLNHTVSLRKEIPDHILLVGESGIHTRDDVLQLQNAGAHAILVGESLMCSEEIGSRVREILGTTINSEPEKEDS